SHDDRDADAEYRDRSRAERTMNPTRILPDLQCSLLCEEVRQEVTGNFFLVGVVNFIRVPQVPVVAFKLSLFNRWTAGIGQFTETARLIAPDQTTLLRKGEVKFVLQDAALHATNVTLFAQVEFKIAGTLAILKFVLRSYFGFRHWSFGFIRGWMHRRKKRILPGSRSLQKG